MTCFSLFKISSPFIWLKIQRQRNLQRIFLNSPISVLLNPIFRGNNLRHYQNYTKTDLSSSMQECIVRVLLLAWAEPKLGMSQLQLKIFSRTLSCFLLAASLLELKTKVPEDHALLLGPSPSWKPLLYVAFTFKTLLRHFTKRASTHKIGTPTQSS